MKLLHRTALAGLLAVLLTSCYKSEDFDLSKMSDAGIDYDLAMPLIDTRMTIDNFIKTEEGVFAPDESGLMHLIYSMEPSSTRVFPDITIRALSSFQNGTGQVPYHSYKDTVIVAALCDTVLFNADGMPQETELKQLRLSKMDWSFRVANTFSSSAEFVLTLDNVLDASGSPVTLRETVEGGNTSDKKVELADVRIVCSESRPLGVSVSSSIRVESRASGQDSVLRYGGVQYSGNFSNMEFSRADGYMPRLPYTVNGYLSIADLGAERMQRVDFQSATLIADIQVAGISTPLRIETSDVRLVNKDNQVPVALFPENYDVAYPDYNADPMVKESVQESSVGSLLVDRPNRFTFELHGLVNPESDKSLMQAIEKDGTVSVGLTCDLPAWFSADEYLLDDTVSMFIKGIDENTIINYFELKTIMKNAFPLDMDLTVVFLDENYQEVFTLFEDRPAKGGEVGPEPDLHVQTPQVTTCEDILEKEQCDLVRTASYIAVRAKVSSIENKVVKIYATSETEGFLDVKLGFRARITQKGLFD